MTIANNSFLLAPATNTNFTQWGVKAIANLNGIVNTNTVIGFSTSQALNVSGIFHQNNLKGASVRCNNVSNLPRGFHHADKNPNMFWLENKMANCWHGMHATTWGTTAIGGIGQQGSNGQKSGNQWLGSTWSASSLQTWVDINTNAGNSVLWVMSSGTESLNTLFQGVQNIQAFSYQNSANTPTTNTGISVCPSNVGGGCLTCSGNFEDYDLDAEIANLLLFISIDFDSLLALNNDTVETWYHEMEDEIGDLFKIESFLAQGDFSSAQSYLNAYYPETNVQENYKSYFQLYKRFAENDSLNATDSVSLLILASQCPAVDGPAIHKARTLYDLVYNTLSFYNDDSCETNGYTGARNAMITEQAVEVAFLRAHEKQQIKGLLRNHYTLFPNPASTKITIRSSKYLGTAIISVVDISGHVLYNKLVSFENNLAVLEFDIINGIYFVQIIDSKNGPTNKKLIINR